MGFLKGIEAEKFLLAARKLGCFFLYIYILFASYFSFEFWSTMWGKIGGQELIKKRRKKRKKMERKKAN